MTEKTERAERTERSSTLLMQAPKSLSVFSVLSVLSVFLTCPDASDMGSPVAPFVTHDKQGYIFGMVLYRSVSVKG